MLNSEGKGTTILNWSVFAVYGGLPVQLSLKLVGNEKWEGSGGWQMLEDGSEIVAIYVCVFFNFVVIFYAIYFRFRLVKTNY